MNGFQYATARTEVCGVRVETMDADGAVQDALRKMLTEIQKHAECGHLVDVTIDVTVNDYGEAVMYTEPSYYVSGEKV